MRIVAFLLVVATAAWAAQDMEYVPIEETRCFACHTTVIGQAVELGVHGEGEMRVDVVPTWRADVVAGDLVVDLAQAPSLRHVAQVEPVHETGNATIGLLEESVTFALVVGDALDDVRLRVAADSPLPHDLRIELEGPAGRLEVDEQSGSRETVRPLDVLGHGTWTVTAWSAPGDISWALDGWGNGTHVREFSMVPEGGRLALRVPVESSDAAAGESVKLTLRAVIAYDHLDPKHPDEAGIVMLHEEELRPGPLGFGPPPVVAPIPESRMDEMAEAVGYATSVLMVASLVSGGVFGKASRRQLNRLFGSAKRRVAFHNATSYAIVSAALAHLGMFLLEPLHHWSVGMFWGGLGIVGLFGLGFTGAMQVPIIRRFSFGTWRWLHLGATVLAVGASVAHVLLDGVHFTDVRDAVGWEDPLQFLRQA